MQTLEQIRDRIDGAEGLQSVVKTMKAVAAVNIRQYEESAHALDVYHATVERGWQATLKSDAGERALRFHGGIARAAIAEEVGSHPLLAIAVGSDQGMCGPFDRIMSEFLVDHFEREGLGPDEIALVVAGDRLRGHLEATPFEVVESLPLPRSAAGVTDVVEETLFTLDRVRRELRAGPVVAFHHRPTEGTSYESLRVPLLPLDVERLHDLRDSPWDGPSLPMIPLPLPAMVRVLTREALFVRVYRAFAASLAAENASRLAAMQAAENSIEERLDELWQTYHRQRQSSITQELLEVVSGFEQAGGEDGD